MKIHLFLIQNNKNKKRLLACLSILFAAQVNGQIINDLELGREFTVVHAEKLIEQAHLNSRAKRSADDESNGYNDDAGR